MLFRSRFGQTGALEKLSPIPDSRYEFRPPRRNSAIRLEHPRDRRHIESVTCREFADVPNPNWLHPGTPIEGQQAFGNDLLMTYGAIAIPSVVSKRTWNLVLLASKLSAICEIRSQEAFALDPRLTLPKTGKATRTRRISPDLVAADGISSSA